MATVPSIKGSIFSRGVEDLRKLVSEGQVSRAELEGRLEPGDRVHLDQPVNSSGWYDVQAYARILELLRDIVGAGSNEYLRARGAGSAEALLEAGLYEHMEYVNWTRVASAKEPEERFRAFGGDLRLLVALYGTILNFARLISRVDPEHPDRYILELSEASAFPSALVWSTDGFINRMARQHGEADLWRWTRPRQDLVVFRMTRSV